MSVAAVSHWKNTQSFRKVKDIIVVLKAAFNWVMSL